MASTPDVALLVVTSRRATTQHAMKSAGLPPTQASIRHLNRHTSSLLAQTTRQAPTFVALPTCTFRLGPTPIPTECHRALNKILARCEDRGPHLGRPRAETPNLDQRKILRKIAKGKSKH